MDPPRGWGEAEVVLAWPRPGEARTAPVRKPALTTLDLPDHHRGAPVRIALLGGFDLVVGDAPVALVGGSERVVALVALRCRAAVPRALVAGTLWPEAPERCAHANLRSALSRLRGPGRRALRVGPNEVGLAPDVEVDVHRSRGLAHAILDFRKDNLAFTSRVVEDLSYDLLPGWYDDWALLAAEEWRQLRLQALDALAADFLAAGRLAEAVATAGAAVHADPLRESSCVLLVRAHLTSGNPAAALVAFERHARRLRAAAGLVPTRRLLDLVALVRRSSNR